MPNIYVRTKTRADCRYSPIGLRGYSMYIRVMNWLLPNGVCGGVVGLFLWGIAARQLRGRTARLNLKQVGYRVTGRRRGSQERQLVEKDLQDFF